MDAAIASMRELELSAPEAALASITILEENLLFLRKHSADLRESWGEDAVRNFAMVDFNDLISRLQDLVPVAVRTYNSLLRDPADGHDSAMQM